MINTCSKYRPHGPQGPLAHQTKTFLLRSCYEIIIIRIMMIMMIQGKGQGPRPGSKKNAGGLMMTTYYLRNKKQLGNYVVTT